MITYKCPSCGGQLNLSVSGSFVCPYCGTKAYMSDSDFNDGEKFRKALLNYAEALANSKENDYEHDGLFEIRGEDDYISKDGTQIALEYMFKYEKLNYTCYLTKESVVYVFDSKERAERFLDGLGMLSFPPADSKLVRSFPEIKMKVQLTNGLVVAFYRRPGFYPAELFQPFPSIHLAWVISRMENICCALEYSGITHGDLNPQSLMINVKTHEGALFGDWSQVLKKKDNRDLESLRRTALDMAENSTEPKEMGRFLHSVPYGTAYDDFGRWDEVINKGFGGHHFHKYN